MSATFVVSILALATLAALLGLALGAIARRLAGSEDTVVAEIDAVLPQTQCGQCGYPGCRPYAEAIAAGEAEINQCPPGGDEGVATLAALLGREPMPLDASRGEPAPPQVAFIREAECIGCTLCIQACPVDAILGANRLMHTVIADECTGCELCIAPCPVDCIDLLPRPEEWLPRRPQPAAIRLEKRPAPSANRADA